MNFELITGVLLLAAVAVFIVYAIISIRRRSNPGSALAFSVMLIGVALASAWGTLLVVSGLGLFR